MDHTWIKVNYEDIPSNVCGIYRLTSPNEKMYIGQSFNIRKRMGDYSRKYCKGQPKLYNSLMFYSNFNDWILEYFECNETLLNDYEKYCIKYYMTTTFMGLNSTDGGSNGKHSNETKEKCRLIHLGKKRTQEAKEKMHLAQLGKTQSEETREKRRLSMLGKNKGKKGHSAWNKGLKTGKPSWNTGIKMSEDFREKARQNHLGKKLSPETREKMREAQKARWNKLKEHNLSIT